MSDVEIMMIEESGCDTTFDLIAGGDPEPTEEVLADGVDASREHIRQLCEVQKALVAQCEVPSRKWIESRDYDPELLDKIQAAFGDRLAQALAIAAKHDRNSAIDAIAQE